MGGNGNDMDVSSSNKRSMSPGKRSSPYRRKEGDDEEGQQEGGPERKERDDEGLRDGGTHRERQEREEGQEREKGQEEEEAGERRGRGRRRGEEEEKVEKVRGFFFFFRLSLSFLVSHSTSAFPSFLVPFYFRKLLCH